MGWMEIDRPLRKPAYVLTKLLLICFMGQKTFFPLYNALHVCCVLSRFIVSNSVQPYGLQPTRLLCPWDSPGKNTGVGCDALLQGIFPTRIKLASLMFPVHFLYLMQIAKVHFPSPFKVRFCPVTCFVQMKYGYVSPTWRGIQLSVLKSQAITSLSVAILEIHID